MKILITLFVIAVVMLLEGFGIWMILGIDQRESTSAGKLFWLSLLVVTHWLGAAVYRAYRTVFPVGGAGEPTPTVEQLRQGLQSDRPAA